MQVLTSTTGAHAAFLSVTVHSANFFYMSRGARHMLALFAHSGIVSGLSNPPSLGMH